MARMAGDPMTHLLGTTGSIYIMLMMGPAWGEASHTPHSSPTSGEGKRRQGTHLLGEMICLRCSVSGANISYHLHPPPQWTDKETQAELQ